MNFNDAIQKLKQALGMWMQTHLKPQFILMVIKSLNAEYG